MPAKYQPQKHNLFTFYGQSNSIDVGGGTPAPALTGTETLLNYADLLMPNFGPDTYNWFNNNGGALSTSLSTYAPGTVRSRSANTFLYSMQRAGFFAGRKNIVHLPGRAGAALSQLSPGSDPYLVYENDIGVMNAAADSQRASRGHAGIFLETSEQDSSNNTSEAAYKAALATFIGDLRNGAQATLARMLPDVPVFIAQLACATRYINAMAAGNAHGPTLGQANAMGEISEFYCSHPTYHLGFIDGVHRNKWGHELSGILFWKAYERWLETGAHKPLRMTSARKVGANNRQVLVTFDVPYGALQVSNLMPAHADGCHGLEVWSGSGMTRYQLSPAEIVNDNQILLRAAGTFSSGALKVRAGWSAAQTLTPDPDSPAYNLPADLTKAYSWTNLCDSDPYQTDLVHSGIGARYDCRNYLLIGEVPVSA